MLTTYSLHGHNIAINPPNEKYMGAGDVKFRNCYQLAHTAYAFQQEFEPREMRMLWKKVNGS